MATRVASDELAEIESGASTLNRFLDRDEAPVSQLEQYTYRVCT